uniref:Expansin n=2 Tax=Cajanus cajan TaxID=3821 RepID=A0A151TVD1_CAJCA|nr:Expansin-A3 [Cajanus cajan]KYP71004.1 Expansin-A3 [Cajanus cajan]
MAFPMGALVTTSWLFLVALVPLPNVHANSWSHAAHNMVGRRNKMVSISPNSPDRVSWPGPWAKAHATFYEGGPRSFGGACGYKDVVKEGYGLDTTALSSVLFKNGQTCGACYELKCVDSPQWCKAGQPSIFVTATNHCPPNFDKPGDDGGWCNPPRQHFDLAKPAYLKIALYKSGIVPVQYRRVPCKKQGGIRFTINGNPYFNLVLVWNVGGAGDVTAVRVKGNKKVINWTNMKRNWGQKWESTDMLVGEKLTFSVRASDGRFSVSRNVVPSNWKFGQTFQGKNFT